MSKFDEAIELVREAHHEALSKIDATNGAVWRDPDSSVLIRIHKKDYGRVMDFLRDSDR